MVLNELLFLLARDLTPQVLGLKDVSLFSVSSTQSRERLLYTCFLSSTGLFVLTSLVPDAALVEE